MAEKTRAEELHDEYRRKVWDDTKSGTENFDKYMLTFSSGALGLSLSFIKDVVPIGKTIWIPALVTSWIMFVLCILTTLVSFRISIRALEKMVPSLDAFYLNADAGAFNKHLESFWTKAVDWCAYLGIFFFVVGLAFTMMFVGANIGEAKRMSKDEAGQKVITGDCGKGLKPGSMTPLEEGHRPPAMTPTRDVGAGVKPVPMTPAPGQERSQPAPASKPAPTKE